MDAPKDLVPVYVVGRKKVTYEVTPFQAKALLVLFVLGWISYVTPSLVYIKDWL